jgi:hypothetical protein
MSYYLFNNEAIGAIGIAAVLRNCKALSYSKTLLILPFLFHKETVSLLKRSNSVIRSSEELMVKKIGNFGNFNSRYYSLLPISINSIMLLNNIGEIEIAEMAIVCNSDNKLDLNSNLLGNRAQNIIKAANKLSEILAQEDDYSLYLKLRIQL